jgi:hypothetical protein
MSSSINSINAEAFRSAVFFSLSVQRWGNRAKVKNIDRLADYLALQKADGSTAPSSVDIGGNMMKATKQLIQSEKLDALNTFLNETKANLCGPFGKANPSKIKDGLFVVSKALVQEFEDTLNAALTEMRDVYLKAFLDDYLPAKERARTLPVKEGGLGPIYDEKDYPLSGDLAEMFGLEWQWLALGVPDDLPAALRAQAAEKLEKQFTEAAEEVTMALRVGFQELIAHAAERLTPGLDGKTKTFRNSLLENIQAFIDVFQDRNIMNDTALAELVNKAQEVLIGIKPDDVRKNADVRTSTLQQFKALEQSLDQIVEVKKSRRFGFAPDAEAAPVAPVEPAVA